MQAVFQLWFPQKTRDIARGPAGAVRSRAPGPAPLHGCGATPAPGSRTRIWAFLNQNSSNFGPCWQYIHKNSFIFGISLVVARLFRRDSEVLVVSLRLSLGIRPKNVKIPKFGFFAPAVPLPCLEFLHLYKRLTAHRPSAAVFVHFLLVSHVTTRNSKSQPNLKRV